MLVTFFDCGGPPLVDIGRQIHKIYTLLSLLACLNAQSDLATKGLTQQLVDCEVAKKSRHTWSIGATVLPLRTNRLERLFCQYGNEGGTESGHPTKPWISRCEHPCSETAWRIVHGSTDLDHAGPRGFNQCSKFRRRPKHCRSPGRIAKPAANAVVGGPQAPPPEFADHKSPAGLQDAGHFHKRSFGILNETKHGHRND